MATANMSDSQYKNRRWLALRGRKAVRMDKHLERVGEADGHLTTAGFGVDHGANSDLKWMNLVHSTEMMRAAVKPVRLVGRGGVLT